MDSKSKEKTYSDCLSRLDACIGRGIRPGLVRFREALVAAGLERVSFRRILIAGTNGKGSTSAMVAEALIHAGLRVGLLTSPHLIDVRERIRINRELISKAQFVSVFSRLEPIIDAYQLTYYEALVLLGIDAFAQEKIDVAVLEVGMGGRWDATNALEPHVTAITTVSYDHQAYLGDTLEKIAAEKAAIARRGTVLVSGVSCPSAQQVILNTCRDVGAVYWEVDTTDAQCEWVPRYLPGAHQRRNAAVAYAILKAFVEIEPRINVSHVRSGILEARHRGRLECVSKRPLLFVDGAHNPEGVEALRAFVTETYPSRRVTLVMAVMADKDYATMLRGLPEWVSELVFVELDEPRALDYQRFAECAPMPCRQMSVSEVTPQAFEDPNDQRLIIVCGSLYWVGAFLGQIERDENRLIHRD